MTALVDGEVTRSGRAGSEPTPDRRPVVHAGARIPLRCGGSRVL